MSEMQTLLRAVETDNARKNFYPTPRALADEMLRGIDRHMISSVLEPSAGKGDLAQAVADWRGGLYNRYGDYMEDIDCIEIDPNLRAILKDKGFRVVHDDFLTLRTFKRYDLIIMNPPFDRGAEHLLKAIDMLEGTGGQIVCLLNAETLRNPCTNARQTLARSIAQYEGTVDEWEGAFAAAERKTNVDVCIVRLTIPEPEKKSRIMDAMRKDAKERKAAEPEQPYAALIKGDYMEAIVDRYNYELSCGLRLIEEWKAMEPVLLEKITKKDNPYNKPILTLQISGKQLSANEYIKKVRKKYWSALFENEQFMAQLTSNLKNDLHGMVGELADYDFSYYNIYTLMQQMLLRVNEGIEQTIIKLFDDWTRKYHWDENSQNRHYFDGWRTNDAFAVEKKVIIPFYGAYSQWSGSFEEYSVTSKVADIEKVFDFLDGGHSVGQDSTSAIKVAAGAGVTKNIQCKYFKITFYKKGTAHIVFTNLDVLHKFNLYAAMNKKWLPPCYGRKRYKDMSKEEQAVVDSFEGEKHYNEVMARADYFLENSAGKMPLLLA